MNKSGKEIATNTLDDFDGHAIKEIFTLKPWMRDCKFRLLTKQVEVEQYVDWLIEKGICALDLETTGLNTRVNSEGKSCAEMVGVCLSGDPFEGIYIPVGHDDKEYNVPLSFMIRELTRLVKNCRCVFHNFKYDGQVLRNYGIIIDDEDQYEDTYLLAAIEDSSRKNKGLKYLSEHLLERPMVEIGELGIKGSKENVVVFSMVPPPKALYYGGPDGMNTLGLWFELKKRMDQQDPEGRTGPWVVYKIEKRCLFVTMEMERNLAKIDKKYLEEKYKEVVERMERLVKGIHELAGRQFDVNSPKQLGQVLFEEMKVKYPSKEKTASGQWQTSEAILDKLKEDYPIVDMILTYRGQQKILGTYITNFLQNADENDEVKFQLNQVQADTGRFSGSGGKGLKIDGYSGVNCQNIPKADPKDPNAVDLRRAIIARPGMKIVTIDYSGEELRIAANFSKEPKWIHEFLHGTGDIHTITGQIIHGRQNITEKERGIGKRLNFLTIYGGGAGGFSAVAKIPYETAKKMMINFFKQYQGLNNWINDEIKRSKKRGFSRTAFGRRRPLMEFFSSTDKGIQSQGNRRAINSAIQGTGADIIKIAMYRVWKWIHENGFEDDVRILLPVHDEIVFEVREDKLDYYVPEICKIMKMRDVTDRLGWEIPLEVDAEYGISFHVTNNYWEERRNEMETPPEEPVETIKPELVKEEKKEVFEEAVPVGEQPKSTDSFDATVGEPGTVSTQHIHFSVTVRDELLGGQDNKSEAKKILEDSSVDTDDKEDVVEVHDAHIKDRIDSRGYLNYPLDVDPITARQLKAALEIMSAYGDHAFVGPRCKICLIDKETKEVWFRTTEKVPVDAFMMSCLWLKI